MKQSAIAIVFLLLGALLPALAQAITDEVTYSYDDLNRLVQATHQQSGRVMDYGYDEVGNITSNIRKGTGVIQGTVTDANGAPLGNATMYATSTGDDPPWVKTDGNGHYRIDGLFPEKSYTLKAQLDPAYGWRINPQPITPTADGTVVDMVLSFPPLDFSVTGTVTLSPACGGAPLADAKVVISSSDSETSLLRTTITDADGNYALPGLPEYANYTLSVAPAATSGLRSVTVYGIDGTSTPAITQNVQIACGGPGIIGTVRIVNVSSQAYAVLWDADHNFVDYQPLTAQNAYGDYTFSFDNLPDGIYKLAISAAGTAPLWYQNAASFAEATPVTPGGPVISMIHPQQGISRNPQGCALYYLDSDQDGYGDPTVIAESCSGQPFGYVLTGNDCNDANASIHPSAVEICDDGIDQDCGNGDLASDPCGICGGDGLACTPAPHDVSNAIGCADCHAAAGGQPVDYACETCHTNSTGRDYDKLN
ncbi:MAG: carboxypeptidase regulatory-like domain-containing protein, partial [Thermodesulfobacteriota bacterium]